MESAANGLVAVEPPSQIQPNIADAVEASALSQIVSHCGEIWLAVAQLIRQGVRRYPLGAVGSAAVIVTIGMFLMMRGGNKVDQIQATANQSLSKLPKTASTTAGSNDSNDQNDPSTQRPDLTKNAESSPRHAHSVKSERESLEEPDTMKQTAQPAALTPKDVFSKVSPAVVEIEVRSLKQERLGSGTGFFFDDKGAVVTNAHVVALEGADHILVTTTEGDERIIKEVYSIDYDRDLALIRFEGPIPTKLEIRNVQPDVGERVFAIGNSLGVLSSSLSEGIVSGIRTIRSIHHLQTTAAISPGNSGGPLVDSQGLVVGVIVSALAYPDSQNINFAVAAEELSRFVSRGEHQQKFAQLQPMKTAANKSGAKETRFLTRTEVLRGFLGVRVIVDDLQPASRAAGLDEQALRKFVESKLKAMEIPIIPDEEQVTARIGLLEVSVSTIASPDQEAYGYIVFLSLFDVVDAIRMPSDSDSSLALARIWCGGMNYGSTPKAKVPSQVRSAITEEVKALADDWKKANNK